MVEANYGRWHLLRFCQHDGGVGLQLVTETSQASKVGSNQNEQQKK